MFAAFPADRLEEEREGFAERIAEGRLPIGDANVEFIAIDDGAAYDFAVADRSRHADIVLFGVRPHHLRGDGLTQLVGKHSETPTALFVLANEVIEID